MNWVKIKRRGFFDSIFSILKASKALVGEYGEDVFIYYLMQDQRYVNRKIYDLDESIIEVEKTFINVKTFQVDGKEIRAGCGIILNDNNLYYIEANNEIEVVHDFNIGYYYENFYDINNFYNSNFGKSISSEEFLLEYYNFKDLSQRRIYFVPEIRVDIKENTNFESYFDAKNTIYELFENIQEIANSSGKRYIINREETIDAVKQLINNYNKKLNYNKYSYYIEFAINQDFVDMLAESQNSEDLLKKYNQNKKSFFLLW